MSIFENAMTSRYFSLADALEWATDEPDPNSASLKAWQKHFQLLKERKAVSTFLIDEAMRTLAANLRSPIKLWSGRLGQHLLFQVMTLQSKVHKNHYVLCGLLEPDKLDSEDYVNGIYFNERYADSDSLT